MSDPIKSALGNLARKSQPGAQPQQIDIEEAIARPQERTRSQAKPKAAAGGRTPGKSSSNDYMRTTVYLPEKLKKDAVRKWEDDTGQDMSDLIEHLLNQYLNA